MLVPNKTREEWLLNINHFFTVIWSLIEINIMCTTLQYEGIPIKCNIYSLILYDDE